VAILSIQSHVTYGHVGNRAAVFPLERMGYEVWPINTVQFSNHTGYESWTGEVFTAAHLSGVWSGIRALGLVAECEAVLSGYMGSAEIGGFILQAAGEVRLANPLALYCCDPVMGDYASGFFVDKSLVDFITRKAVPDADIITPNQFEAEAIWGSAISSLSDAKQACEAIHARGPRLVLITSFKPQSQAPSEIALFLSSKEGFYLLTTPQLPLDPRLSGAGDLCSALFLGHYLASGDPPAAMELMADSLYSVLEATSAAAGRELRLVQAQAGLARPQRRFEARRV
jgi:pyridoxine kinase